MPDNKKEEQKNYGKNSNDRKKIPNKITEHNPVPTNFQGRENLKNLGIGFLESHLNCRLLELPVSCKGKPMEGLTRKAE